MRVTRGLQSLLSPRQGKPVPAAVTIGNFDGVHRAHLAMLERTVDAAADLGLCPTVLTFHPSPKEFFARQAGAPIAARISTLADKLCRFREAGIEHVVIARFNAELAHRAAEQFIAMVLEQQLGTRWLLVGDDFRFGYKRGGTIDTLRASSTFTVEQMRTVMIEGHRVSSTSVRAALQAGQLELAEKLLGRPYAITGRVAHGQKLGRSLGFPTANLPLRFTPALSGVCAVEVTGLDNGDGRRHFGVASLGVRPTVNAAERPLLETFLFDFDQPIYGHKITVSFLHKLRDEIKYPDLASLQAQIRVDAEQARAFVERLERAA